MSGPRRAPISDADAQAAVDLLQRRGMGLAVIDLPRHFGSIDRGRATLAAITARGMAAVVLVDAQPGGGSGLVYRLARTGDEVRAEADRLEAYERALRKQREGLITAWKTGGVGQGQLLWDEVAGQL